MKYSCSIDINAPIEKTVALFTDADKTKLWREGYVSTQPISGKPGEVGSKAKITFNMHGREIILTETILVNDLPHELKGLYEHEHMSNTMSNRFSAIDANRTRYEGEVDYTHFKFIPKMISLFMPGVFKKPVKQVMESFKAFAEGQK